MKARKEVISKYSAKYKKATKKRKGEILDVVCDSTGLSRDRAARLLSSKSHARCASKGKRGRKRIYDDEFCVVLIKIWAMMDFPCGKRMAEMSDALLSLRKFGEIDCGSEVFDKLLMVSASTIDRIIKPEKQKLRYKGIATTKPGTLLKKDIPLRLGTQWDDAVPGYVEIDLVAHCGAHAAGEYINSLDVTDICTGWTDTQAIINKAQVHTFGALMDIEQRLPFPYLGIDSDNGSEFINHELYRYCKENGIVFTRTRPYQKNDNCHVEQKNWSVIRRNIGYDRYEGQEALRLLNAYYDRLRLYTNFFQPQTKLIKSTRAGAKVTRIYEKHKTPYRRVLESEYIAEEVKEALCELYETLNPAALKREMINISEQLKKVAIPWNENK
jgi:hypothetical protein